MGNSLPPVRAGVEEEEGHSHMFESPCMDLVQNLREGILTVCRNQPYLLLRLFAGDPNHAQGPCFAAAVVRWPLSSPRVVMARAGRAVLLRPRRLTAPAPAHEAKNVPSACRPVPARRPTRAVRRVGVRLPDVRFPPDSA